MTNDPFPVILQIEMIKGKKNKQRCRATIAPISREGTATSHLT